MRSALVTNWRVVIQADITAQGCDQIDVSASAAATTFYGIPGPVANARVVNDNDSSGCVIAWEHDDESFYVLHYNASTLYCRLVNRIGKVCNEYLFVNYDLFFTFSL